MEISGWTLKKVLDKAKDYESVYHLNGYNCTNFARDVGNVAGMNIPSAWGYYPGGGGQNPGGLGEVLRDMDGENGITADLEGGNAPSKSNDCK